MEYTRVRDRSTGHHYSVISSAVHPTAHEVLDEPAVDVSGTPLPPEYSASPSAAESSNEADADLSGRPESLSSQTNGHQANTEKEID